MNLDVLTHTGQRVELLNPHPATIRLTDIAVSLSRQARFNGHTVHVPWSVAEHSMLVAEAVVKQSAFLVGPALLHDAAEAYIGDLVHPLKSVPSVRRAIKPIEEGLNRAIEQAFGLLTGELSLEGVKKADLVALATEARDLMPHDPRPWPALKGVDPLPGGIDITRAGRPDVIAEVFEQRVREAL